MAIPQNLMDEVLCRVPVKSLLRFRCVSKGWCSRIDSTAFMKKQLKKSLEFNAGSALMIRDGGSNFYIAPFDMLDDVSASVVQVNEPIKSLLVDAELVGTCKGLVCMFKERSKMHDLFIMNLATKKSRKVPHWPHDFPTFFSSGENFMYGFGYDKVNDDYKVVKIAECRYGLYGILVYSLKTNAWIEVPNRTNFLFSSQRGIFASGSLHWLARGISTNCTEFIVAFDLELQEFKEVPLPPIVRKMKKSNYRYFVGLEGCLCMIDSYPDSCTDVWLMKNYENQIWYKVLTVDQLSTLGLFRFFNPIAFSKNYRDVLLEVDHKKLVWHSLDNNTVRNVGICGIPVKFYSFLFTQSLLQINENRPLHHKTPQQKPPKDKKEKHHTKQRDDFLSKGFKLNL